MATVATDKLVEAVDWQKINIFSERVSKRKQEYLAAKPFLCPERSRIFRESWGQTENESLDVRFALAFSEILERIPVVIREGELIVGSQTPHIRGCYVYPEYDAEALLKELNGPIIRIGDEVGDTGITEEARKSVLEDASYWKERSVAFKMRKAQHQIWGDKMTQLEAAGLFTPRVHDQTAGSKSVDYEQVVKKGLNTILAEARDELNSPEVLKGHDIQKAQLLHAVIISCEGLIAYAGRHAELARRMAEGEKDPRRKRELERIGEICERVPANPARNFYEALQSFWFIHLGLYLEVGSPGICPGRFDQYMYPFYVSDMETGRITKDEIGELLGCLWVKFTEMEIYKNPATRSYAQASTFQNVTIGGVTRDGKDACNDLTHFVLETARQVKVHQPHVSLRCHNLMSEDIWLHAVEANIEVPGTPAYFNDHAALLGICSNWGIALEEAREWAVSTCVRRQIPGCSAELKNFMLNLPKVLELTLYNGLDPKTQKRVGPETGDPTKFKTFDEFKRAFLAQLAYAIQMTFAAQELAFVVRGDNYRVPLTSALMHDCMKKGRDALCGGLRTGTMERTILPYGYTNPSDSLVAIKKVVFEDRLISMAELIEALKADFAGGRNEEIRGILLKAPKYGNDDDYADEMMRYVYKWVKDIASEWKNGLGQTGLVAAPGGVVHYHYGRVTGALPDGRRAWTPLADSNLAPSQGMDRKGPTAVLNSAVKADTVGYESGNLNQRFSPLMLKTMGGKQKLTALIKSYFARYGYQLQLNIIDAGVLQAAKANPQSYGDLLVRVAGYNAHFVELSPEVQNEIIARTEQMI